MSDFTELKVAVITGASSGIGRATALQFAENGYNVVLAARRFNDLTDVAEACNQYNVKAVVFAADVTDADAVQKIADKAIAEFGHFDVWVNDAAVALYAKFDDIPMDGFRRVIETNLFGYVHGARTALKQFKRQGYGTLINVSSINALAPMPYATAYVVSKFAVRGLSLSLRMELELEGLARQIHVCNVMPASIDTNLFQNAANYTGREIRALEPVYEPAYVAKQIAGLADRPLREIIVGPAGKLMASQYQSSPKIYEWVMSRFVDRNHLGKDVRIPTDGNLYDSIPDNEGVAGGWRQKRLRADRLNTTLGLVATGLLAAAGASYFYMKRQRSVR